MWKRAGLGRIKNEDVDVGLAILAHDTVPGFPIIHILTRRGHSCVLWLHVVETSVASKQ